MLTSGTIGSFGDILCQTFENYQAKDKKGFNFQRTKNFFIIGTFFIAPILHVSYSKFLPYLVPEVTPIGAIKKLAVDQLLLAPLIIVFFYPAINFIEGNPFSKAVQDLKDKYVETMKVNYKIWPAANFINFCFVPIQYQVLWANFVSLFFNAGLSYLHNTYKHEDKISVTNVEKKE